MRQTLYQPGMVLFPSGPNSEQIHLNSPPPPQEQEFTRQQPKKILDQDPSTTQLEGNLAQS